MSSVDLQDFAGWFVDCLMEGAKTGLAPNDYVWDLRNCQEWREEYEGLVTPTDAVAKIFGQSH